MAEGGGETSVDTENLASDNGGNRQRVETVNECLPDFDIAPPLALVVEPVNSGHVGALVVAAEKEKVLGELELVAEEQQNGLERLLPPVNIVTQEEVVGHGREATHLKHSDQVRVLSVDIADDLDWGVQLQQSRLRQEHLSRTLANGDNLGILEADTLGHLSGVTRIKKTLNKVIKVNILNVSHGYIGIWLAFGVGGRLLMDGVDGILPLHQDGLARSLHMGVDTSVGRGGLVGDVVNLARGLGSAHIMVAALGRTMDGGRRRLVLLNRRVRGGEVGGVMLERREVASA